MTSAWRRWPLSSAISPKKSPLPRRPPVRQHHFERTGGDQKHRVATLALADHRLVGHQEPRPEQAGERLQCGGTEAGEHLELSEQIFGAQPEIERRKLVHQRTDRLVLPLEILEDLLSDQPLVVEIVESCQRQTEAGLAQETLLKCLGIFPILQAQRIEGARRCLTAG